MKTVSHQTLIGACIAATLILGASATPNGGVTAGSLGAARFEPFRQEAVAQIAAIVQSGRDLVLDVAFDAYGEIASRLKLL
jgi:hypothetical protein